MGILPPKQQTEVSQHGYAALFPTGLASLSRYWQQKSSFPLALESCHAHLPSWKSQF